MIPATYNRDLPSVGNSVGGFGVIDASVSKLYRKIDMESMVKVFRKHLDHGVEGW